MTSIVPYNVSEYIPRFSNDWKLLNSIVEKVPKRKISEIPFTEKRSVICREVKLSNFATQECRHFKRAIISVPVPANEYKQHNLYVRFLKLTDTDEVLYDGKPANLSVSCYTVGYSQLPSQTYIGICNQTPDSIIPAPETTVYKEHSAADFSPLLLKRCTSEDFQIVIDMQYTPGETYEDFLLEFALAKEVDLNDYIPYLLKSGLLISANNSDTEALIRKILETNGDSECQMLTFDVEFKCPISMKKMTIPVRHKGCDLTHLHDLESYLRMNLKAVNPRWRCINCKKKMYPEDLCIETYFQKIFAAIDKNTKATVVTFSLDDKQQIAYKVHSHKEEPEVNYVKDVKGYEEIYVLDSSSSDIEILSIKSVSSNASVSTEKSSSSGNSDSSESASSYNSSSE